jgi:tRNA dimethylallyltransferase
LIKKNNKLTQRSKKNLIVIVGPTAVGKTKLSIQLAQHFNTEVLSADSRQFYKEMSIGTAKPDLNEMEGIKHHFIDSHSIHDYFSIGDYEREANILIEDLFKTHNCIILTGGSGMFVKAVLEGIDEMPPFDPVLRAELIQKQESLGLEWFQNQLKVLDFETYQTIELNNFQRVFRAVEVSLQSGKPYHSFLGKNKIERKYNVIKIGIDRPREELYHRINQRVDLMIKNGLIEEAISLQEFKSLNALQTVGYKEIYQFLNTEFSKSEMIDKIKQNSRRYAKRQLTWFKNQDEFNWFHPDSYFDILNFIESKI